MATSFTFHGSASSAPTANLSTYWTDLRNRIAYHLGYGRTGWTSDSEKVANVNDAVKDGLRWFYTPELVESRFSYRWSFLRPTFVVTTTADYSTGTITVASGVVTLSGGTWPSAAASGELYEAENGNTYTVASRDSDTQLTLDDTSVDVTAGTSYWLAFPQVDLPADFASIEGDKLTYDPGVADLYPAVQLVSEQQIRRARMDYDDPDKPSFAAVVVKAHDFTVGTRYALRMLPVPDGAYRLTGRYRINPDMIDATNLYPPGSETHAATLLASCLAAADRNVNDGGNGMWEAQFKSLLAASIAQDAEATSARRLGYSGDGSEDPPVEPTHAWLPRAPSYDNDS